MKNKQPTPAKSNVEIYNECCIERMEKMSDCSVDLTVTSPPYDNLRSYKDTLNWNFDVFCDVASGLYRVTKNGGVVVWIVSDATIKGTETGSSFRQALHFKDLGFNLYDTMIWEKASRIPTQSRYYNVIEYMFILSKGKPKSLNFITDHKNKTKGQKRRKDKVINKGTNQKHDDKWIVTGEYSRRSNIWKYGTSGNGTNHPAIFPEKLAHDHIISWSNEGDTIFDPFMGSGTVGKVAIETNRCFIGCEIVPEYYQISEKRIKQNDK